MLLRNFDFLNHFFVKNIKVISITMFILTVCSFSCSADINEGYKIQMSLDDIFIIPANKQWNIKIQKIVTLRFADVNIKPKKGYNFNLQLYFKCDTPDLAHFDTSDKMRKSVLYSSLKYLPYIVQKKITLKDISVKGWYGCYTVLTDKQIASKANIPDGEFNYMTRGMVRLSPDSALGFSLMTNTINSGQYNKLFDFIKSFVKERK